MGILKIKKEDIEAVECKHAVYVEANDGSGDDLVFIKERVKLKSGEIVSNVRSIVNFKRDFYITKERYRKKDSQKTEWEDLHKLQKFTCTQSNLIPSIKRALGTGGSGTSLRRVAKSPFIFGADITTPTIIKQRYQSKYPDFNTENSVCVLDIETDVVKGHGEPIYVCLSFKDKVFLGATSEFLTGIKNPIDKLRAKADELLGDIIKERNIDLEIKVFKNPGAMLEAGINRAHKWRPDFLAVWNIDFDIPEIVKTLKKYLYSPARVFSDPSVPNRFKNYKYNKGQTIKVTVTGKSTPIPFVDRWNTVDVPASFFLIDAMAVYKRVRAGRPNEPGYSLDAVLERNLGVRKLKFKETEHLSGLELHRTMQTKYRIEYGIYNIFDCIGVELLDEKTKDLALSLSVASGYSEYQVFDKQPKRLVDKLHFFCKDRDRVIATTSSDMDEELDDLVMGMNGHIITLPSFSVVNDGMRVIEELPNFKTMMWGHVNDLDVKGAYPYAEIVLNVSKETTYRELSKIEGVDETTMRRTALNLTASHVNAVEISTDIYNVPNLIDLLKQFKEEKKIS